MLLHITLLALALACVTAQPPSSRLTEVRAAFSRFRPADGIGAVVERHELISFVQHLLGSSAASAASNEALVAKSLELTRRLLKFLPAEASSFGLPDMLNATAAALRELVPPPPPPGNDFDRLGSKQLAELRRRVRRNRLTMPLFDSGGWVRDFEKALRLQWEVYACGLAPMVILVARSERLYGTDAVV